MNADALKRTRGRQQGSERPSGPNTLGSIQARAFLVFLAFVATAAAAGIDTDEPLGKVTRKVAAIDQGIRGVRDEKRADMTYWAFQPVRFSPVPSSSSLSPNPIDHFVFARLAEQHLAPSPEADRRTLIRRAYFDVVGLPPTPEAVEAFQNDAAPDAYARLVDGLLASPHYGERWARHWLDTVRFAESHGFEMNQPRENAWPYRDYVIHAFNEDKPYDRFILEQLAGDAFGVDEATGFLVGGAWDQVKSPDVVLTSNQRADELHDMVSTTGSTFLGLTVGCVRCHDHKFDPIPQTDYYAIKACFAGVQHGERAVPRPDAAAREQKAARCREKIDQLDAQLLEYEPLAFIPDKTGADVSGTNHFLRAAVHPRQNIERFAPVLAKRVRFRISKTTGAEPCIDELEVYTAGEKSRDIALASAGAKARASGVYPNSELHKLEHINDGKYGNSRSWISNEPGKGWVELEFPEPTTINRIVWGRDREEKYADRLATEYSIEVAAESDERHWKLVASSADRQPYVPGRRQEPVLNLAGLTPSGQARLNESLAERVQQELELKDLTNVAMVYAGKFTKPEATFRFHRGDPMHKREEILPGPLSALPVKFGVGAEESVEQAFSALSSKSSQPIGDQQRRLALAKWITNPANPLTPRVIVNRLWEYHFGEGLVSTPSDFGINGARPTHPELLDWLAAEFMQHGGWSLKHIHRLILTSAAYRQSSAARSDCLAADAGSRLLWRFPPRRLEAEAIRDSILAVSGQLNLKMGGPGFSSFGTNNNYVRVYEPKNEFGPEDWRRMIYATTIRQRPDGVFGVFDCPDGGQIAPKRSRSTTPLQALNLMNSGFIMQQAGFLAERLKQEAGPKPAAQVQRAFGLAFNRRPDAKELSAATQIVREQDLIIFCRALFNANEFVYAY